MRGAIIALLASLQIGQVSKSSVLFYSNADVGVYSTSTTSFQSTIALGLVKYLKYKCSLFPCFGAPVIYYELSVRTSEGFKM